jgi:Fe-S-cluster containining protein
VIEAGPFGAWLDDVRAAVHGERDAVVPCGDCTGCCTSSQFVHIASDETDALTHIPDELLFDAPGFPAGHVLMGYDEHGHCPMLVDGGCSIYQHRPRTCRTYDCRIFAAAGVVPDAPAIAARVSQWQFSYVEPGDDQIHAAVRAAACEVAGAVNATERALRAVMTSPDSRG